jgi:hypothetical protein
MAIAVIGGLLISTVLSLIFVPSFYAVMEGISERVGRFLGRFVGPKEEAGEEGGHRPDQPAQVRPPQIRTAAE